MFETLFGIAIIAAGLSSLFDSKKKKRENRDVRESHDRSVYPNYAKERHRAANIPFAGNCEKHAAPSNYNYSALNLHVPSQQNDRSASDREKRRASRIPSCNRYR